MFIGRSYINSNVAGKQREQIIPIEFFSQTCRRAAYHFIKKKKGTRTPKKYKETHNTHYNTPHRTLQRTTHTQPENSTHCGEPEA
jgi:hypothetical protein